MTVDRPALVIWCIEDDRAGHRRQLAGLAGALQALRPAHIYRVGRTESPAQLPAPDLILTAGRRSHWRGLRYRHLHGGKLVALMDPGLPRTLFDLSIIPEHDGVPPAHNVLLSKGPLNPVKPASAAAANRGLILVGGPSRHYRWDNTHLASQLQRLQAALPEVAWTLTTSPRTPASFIRLARQLANPGLEVVALAETSPDWLLQQYARCGVIWVSEDSASMVYESLSCGAAVGVLSVPVRRPGRVSRGIEKLLEEGQPLRLHDLETRGNMPPPPRPLQEATRIAQTITRWLDQAGTPAGGTKRQLGGVADAFAGGDSRLCFVDPADPAWCIKVLRPDRAPHRKRRDSPWLKRLKPVRLFDDNLQDIRVYRHIERRIGPAAYQLVARIDQLVPTNLGPGLRCELIRDDDGGISVTLQAYLARHGADGQLRAALSTFSRQWRALGMPSRRLLPANIVVQRRARKPARLVVVDSLGWADLVPLGYWFAPWARLRAGRKLRYLADLVADGGRK